MDQSQVDSPQAEANKFYATLRPSGYDQAYARELARLVRSLMKSTSSLQTRAGQQLNLIIDPGGNDMPLQHDERLLPYWERFTDALSSRSKCSALTRFALINVKMNDRKVAEMLLKTVKNAPLNVLYFCNNGLGEREYNWIINLLNANTSLQTLCIGSNPMNPSQELVANLSKAVVDHSKLDVILLDNCGIGQNISVMKAVLNIFCLRKVCLKNNDIDSYGATLISDCLITNPPIKELSLEDNFLNNEDAKKFASSLKSNTNLRMLRLPLNNMTAEGVLSISKSIFNTTSLNSMGVSNHTCAIQFKAEEDVLYLKCANGIHINEHANPVINKNLKLFLLLPHYLKDDTPLQIIPKVLALLNSVARNDEILVARNELDAIFGFMKEWSMPLLYTSRCIGKDPRRSNRIRKKMVLKYMGEK